MEAIAAEYLQEAQRFLETCIECTNAGAAGSLAGLMATMQGWALSVGAQHPGEAWAHDTAAACGRALAQVFTWATHEAQADPVRQELLFPAEPVQPFNEVSTSTLHETPYPAILHPSHPVLP